LALARNPIKKKIIPIKNEKGSKMVVERNRPISVNTYDEKELAAKNPPTNPTSKQTNVANIQKPPYLTFMRLRGLTCFLFN
jgi:hypothetical protein